MNNAHSVNIPPQSLEAEASVLCSLLRDKSALTEVAQVLTPEDFYRQAHGRIYNAILNLFEKNEPIDLVTVTHALQQADELEKIGGGAFLAELVDLIPMSANLMHHARIIHDKACLRSLIQKAGAISQKCFEDRENVDDVIDFAESSIFEVSENKIKPAYAAIGDIIHSAVDILEARNRDKSMVTGVPTGFTELDKLTAGFQASDMIILAARPSMGKTALALNIARNAAINGGVPVVVYSLEMSKEQLTMRLLASEARIDSSKLRTGFFTQDDFLQITEAAGRLSDVPIYIDDSADLSAIEVRAKSRRLKMEKNIGMVVIDYIQLMKGRASSERRELEISEISRSLKGLAKELNVPVVALSQLNRKLEERADKRPQLSDLRESGSLEQDADIVAFIYRDEVYNRDENNPNRGRAEVIIAKQRNGPTGVANLAFLNAYTRFEDLAVESMAPF